MASQSPPVSAGIIRSQLTCTSWQVSPISAQSAAAMSMSKPVIVPSSVTSENGGYAPSTQIPRAAAGAPGSVAIRRAAAIRPRVMKTPPTGIAASDGALPVKQPPRFPV